MHDQLIKSIFVALTPKLGGGGLTPDLVDEIRHIALPQLDQDQLAICGIDTPQIKPRSPQRVGPYNWPRRSNILLNSPAEMAIRAAVNAVERAGCHVFLTDAVNLLDQAREKVADFVELPINIDSQESANRLAKI